MLDNTSAINASELIGQTLPATITGTVRFLDAARAQGSFDPSALANDSASLLVGYSGDLDGPSLTVASIDYLSGFMSGPQWRQAAERAARIMQEREAETDAAWFVLVRPGNFGVVPGPIVVDADNAMRNAIIDALGGEGSTPVVSDVLSVDVETGEWFSLLRAVNNPFVMLGMMELQPEDLADTV